ncbi:Enoate reductase 1 [Yarrowia sp. E02]|nr:Enoate reductase 1 [Yarrowia sp. E02]
MTQTHNLFSPIKVGSSELKNRVVLAPLTRTRALPGNIPSDLAVEYYAQRAVAPGTLLITEATYISPGSAGVPIPGDGIVPGIWSDEQLEAWKKVFKAVHDRGSKIYVQLWDIGRVAWYHKLQELGNYFPSGPSAIPMKGEDGEHLKALTNWEVKGKVALYVNAAKNAIAAGADGVEIHAANGYLPDTFLRSASNQRTDEYGGSVENRARFPLEIVDAVTEAIGADKTAIRLSPWSTFQDIEVNNTETPEQFTYLFEQLQKRADEGNQLAYVHVVEPRLFGPPEPWATNEPFRKIWKGNFVRAGGYEKDTAIEDADKAENTLIAFGRHFISNPDLVERLQKDESLAQYDRNTFYVPGAKGYTDYPEFKEEKQ